MQDDEQPQQEQALVQHRSYVPPEHKRRAAAGGPSSLQEKIDDARRTQREAMNKSISGIPPRQLQDSEQCAPRNTGAGEK